MARKEFIRKDGMICGVRLILEPGDKKYEQFGEYVEVKTEPTKEDYEKLFGSVITGILETTSKSSKEWTLESAEIVRKTKEDYGDNYPFAEDTNGTLGVKVAIYSIFEEGDEQ